jgi:predicted nucleic acid-binding protein
MSSYFDTSVIVSSLRPESNSELATELINNETDRFSSPLTVLETRRSIHQLRLFKERSEVLRIVDEALQSFSFVMGKGDIWQRAAEIAEKTGVKSLDAIHLAAASYLEIEELQFVTFDKKQADAARAIGLTVVGA